MNEAVDNAIGILIMLVSLGFMLFFLSYIGVSIDARNACHEAGWMKQKVDLNFTRYCTSRIDGSDIIVPFDEAIENGNFSNLYIRETFKLYATEEAK